MHDTWKSKKLWFAIGVIVFAFAFAVLSATTMPTLAPMFEQFCSVLEFVSAAYLTGNVANKFVAGKVGAAAAAEAPKVAASKKALEAAPPGGPRVPED